MIKQFKINVPINGYKAGKIIDLECDESNIPVDLYWFRRYKDSAIDQCISLVNAKLKDKKDESLKS